MFLCFGIVAAVFVERGLCHLAHSAKYYMQVQIALTVKGSRILFAWLNLVNLAL
jgi:hypothetical protein